MTCSESRRLVHDYLDERLTAHPSALMERHLFECAECRRAYNDFQLMRQAIAVRHPLPGAARARMLRRLERSRRRTMQARFVEAWDRFCTFWRDLERPVLWSKLGAVPVTGVFFFALMLQFSPSTANLTLPVFHADGWAADHLRVHSISLRPTRSQMNELVEAAWKTPYEDSFVALAEITPDNGIQVVDVLEYPKNLELLRTWDLALQNSRIDTRGETRQTVLLFNQKIDVYEGL